MGKNLYNRELDGLYTLYLTAPLRLILKSLHLRFYTNFHHPAPEKDTTKIQTIVFTFLTFRHIIYIHIYRYKQIFHFHFFFLFTIKYKRA